MTDVLLNVTGPVQCAVHCKRKLKPLYTSGPRYAGHNVACAEKADQSAVSTGGLFPESRGFAGPSSFAQFALVNPYFHKTAFCQFAKEQFFRERLFDMFLDHTGKRAGAHFSSYPLSASHSAAALDSSMDTWRSISCASSCRTNFSTT